MTDTDIQVVTYHSTNAKPNEAWLAYVVIDGKQWLVRFAGADEASVYARAKAFYKTEKARQERLAGEEAPEAHVLQEKRSVTVSSGAAANVASGWGSSFPAGNKEHRLAGSVWVANAATKHKTRIAANELQGYLDKGYVKAGPRTKI